MNAVLDGVRRLKRQSDSEAQAAYRTLVREVTEGVEQDPAETTALLERAGRTVEDLERDCAFLETRREKLAEVAKLPAIRAKLHKVRQAIQANLEELQEAMRRHEAEELRLRAQRQELELAESKAEAARAWTQTNLPAELKAEVDRLVALCGPLAREENALREALNDDLSHSPTCKLRGAEQYLEDVQQRRRPPVKNLELRINSLRREVEAARARLPIVSRELAAIHARIDAILAKESAE